MSIDLPSYYKTPQPESQEAVDSLESVIKEILKELLRSGVWIFERDPMRW
jgi:hypothetical protein